MARHSGSQLWRGTLYSNQRIVEVFIAHAGFFCPMSPSTTWKGTQSTGSFFVPSNPNA